MSSQVTGVGTSNDGEFGANEWLVAEMYEQYTKDRNSVDRAWWPILDAYQPQAETASAATASAPPSSAPAPVSEARPVTAPIPVVGTAPVART
ncbi:2-oxoglutarate dehydrogenase E1 subunit family protein, partial [Microbacterium sp.]|uniref:2-oxoglutarate dehydrogenase E1 subunit family protein n=1 Tax=Microbacterium sp. TaxID=51671 RepID=UPI0039E608D8